ncbi:MAG: hypothetical protein ACREK8_12135 [Gemmatimonadales bacterium]
MREVRLAAADFVHSVRSVWHGVSPSDVDRRRRDAAWLIFTIVIAGLVLLLALNRGWEPVGESAIAESAVRVLHGEVPHRDFDDLYTGGLTYVHAAAFAIGGIRLSILRVPLFLTGLGWIVALFLLACRMLPAPAAALLTLTGVAWSLPNDSSPMPSWYNLFLATFAIYALARWIDDRRATLLVLAGALGGVSFLMKLSGVFLIAGGGLFLIAASRDDDSTPAPRSRNFVMPALVTVTLFLFAGELWRSIGSRGVESVFHFAVPVASIAAGLAWGEWSTAGVAPGVRFRSLAAVLLPYLAGLLLVVGPYAVFLAANGALNDTLRDVFVSSFARLEFAGMKPPRLFWLLAVVPLMMLLRPRADHAAPAWRVRAVILALLLAGALIVGTRVFFVQQIVWEAVRSLALLLGIVTGVLLAVRPEALGLSPKARQFAVLVGIVAVLHSLIQFPFAGANYFFFVAPLLFLAAAAMVQMTRRTPAGIALVVTGFYLVFAVLEVLPGSKAGLSLLPSKRDPPVTMLLPRVGLQVTEEQASIYDRLIPEVQARAGGGVVWAGPEAPQIYFLGGFRNPARTSYNFFDADSRREAGLLHRLEQYGAKVIVINGAPAFSPPLPAPLLDSLAARFPAADSIGPFVVRWR